MNCKNVWYLQTIFMLHITLASFDIISWNARVGSWKKKLHGDFLFKKKEKKKRAIPSFTLPRKHFTSLSTYLNSETDSMRILVLSKDFHFPFNPRHFYLCCNITWGHSFSTQFTCILAKYVVLSRRN